MSRANEKFINQRYLDYTKQCFAEFFRESLFLEKEKFSNEAAGMGFYQLIYNYKNYQIIFEYEKLRFTIRITYEEAHAHLLEQHTHLSNSLKADNIQHALVALKKDILEDRLVFFKMNKNGKRKQVNMMEGMSCSNEPIEK